MMNYYTNNHVKNNNQVSIQFYNYYYVEDQKIFSHNEANVSNRDYSPIIIDKTAEMAVGECKQQEARAATQRKIRKAFGTWTLGLSPPA